MDHQARSVRSEDAADDGRSAEGNRDGMLPSPAIFFAPAVPETSLGADDFQPVNHRCIPRADGWASFGGESPCFEQAPKRAQQPSLPAARPGRAKGVVAAAGNVFSALSQP